MLRTATNGLVQLSRGRKSFRAPISLSTVSLRRSDDDEDEYCVYKKQQRRGYHETPRREMVLYGTIIIVVALGYVGVRKYRGEPIKPESATEAQENFRKLEEERRKRNEKQQSRVKIMMRKTKSDTKL